MELDTLLSVLRRASSNQRREQGRGDAGIPARFFKGAINGALCYFITSLDEKTCGNRDSKKHSLGRKEGATLVENYISQIGAETADRMKFRLYSILESRYGKEHDDAGKLAADVVNYLFENRDAFYSSCRDLEVAKRNAKAVREWADERLCFALSCAVYNSCYGEYIRQGGRVGFCGSKFLGYFRAFQIDDFQTMTRVFQALSNRSLCNSVLPFMALKAAGLWRNLPGNPDPKKLAAVVYEYDLAAGPIAS